jgi:serine/threonine protein kinase
MVFQPLEMNLRKLLKTYGREVGITLTAIRMYARQMFHGLLHMQKCSVLHGDIKLDNILISKDLKNVAICDFGTADWAHEVAPCGAFCVFAALLCVVLWCLGGRDEVWFGMWVRGHVCEGTGG